GSRARASFANLWRASTVRVGYLRDEQPPRHDPGGDPEHEAPAARVVERAAAGDRQGLPRLARGLTARLTARDSTSPSRLPPLRCPDRESGRVSNGARVEGSGDPRSLSARSASTARLRTRRGGTRRARRVRAARAADREPS